MAAKRGRPSIYDWERLFALGAFELRAGRDYDKARSQTVMNHAIRNAARRHGVQIIITELESRDGFEVRVVRELNLAAS